MRLIDADELITAFPCGETVTTECVRGTIRHMPTIEPKQGEWEIKEIRNAYGRGYRLTCSECGDTFNVTENAFLYERYCRSCGARMYKYKPNSVCTKAEKDCDNCGYSLDCREQEGGSEP